MFVALAYVGSWPFGLLVTAIGLVAQTELFAMAEAKGFKPHRIVGLFFGALVGLVPLMPQLVPVLVALVVVFIALSPFILDATDFLSNLMVTLGGAFYPTGLLSGLTWLRMGRGPEVDSLMAFWLVLFIVFIVWGTDIFAYYVGKNLGAHKLAPTISPKKTWEGSAGGLVTAVLVAIAFKLLILPVLSWVDVGVLALLGGGVSQMGDLAESQIKRSTGIKDAGSILPGHGGLFDRFDSMMIAAPLVYLYLRYIAGLMA